MQIAKKDNDNKNINDKIKSKSCNTQFNGKQ